MAFTAKSTALEINCIKNFVKINKPLSLHSFKREFSSVGLEHLPYKQRVTGSTPVTPTSNSAFLQNFFLWVCLCLVHPGYRGREGHRFDSCNSHQSGGIIITIETAAFFMGYIMCAAVDMYYSRLCNGIVI
jgi:hypothetical protein